MTEKYYILPLLPQFQRFRYMRSCRLTIINGTGTAWHLKLVEGAVVVGKKED